MGQAMLVGLGPRHHELVRQTIETYMHGIMQRHDPMFWDDALEHLLLTWAERDGYYLTEASIQRVFDWCYGVQEQAQEEDRQWARQQKLAVEQAAAQRAEAGEVVRQPMAAMSHVAESSDATSQEPSALAAAAIHDNAESQWDFSREAMPEEWQQVPQGPAVVSRRQIKSIWHLYDEMVAQGYQPSALESAGVAVLRTLLPPSAPSTETVYSDGTIRLDLGGGPSSEDLAGQASIFIGAFQAASRAATVVGKFGEIAKELIREVAEEAGLPPEVYLKRAFQHLDESVGFRHQLRDPKTGRFRKNTSSQETKPLKDPDGESAGGTYTLKDPDTGEVVRTGRTSALERRKAEHARHPETEKLEFDVDRHTENYAQQRGREQILHEQYEPPMNKINPISPRNPKRAEYLKAAEELE